MLMNEKLQIAYDMLHQIQCLPCEHADTTKVDGYETDTTLLERATMLVKLLEGNVKPKIDIRPKVYGQKLL